MIGKRPSKKTVEAVKLAVKVAQSKTTDAEVALQLWRDLRWKMQTTVGSYMEIDKLISEAEINARTNIVSSAVRDPVLKRLAEMRARVSEFTVEPDPQLLFCSSCGREIAPDEYRKELIGSIADQFVCAICAALQ
jgi:hypothetical protein